MGARAVLTNSEKSISIVAVKTNQTAGSSHFSEKYFLRFRWRTLRGNDWNWGWILVQQSHIENVWASFLSVFSFSKFACNLRFCSKFYTRWISDWKVYSLLLPGRDPRKRYPLPTPLGEFFVDLKSIPKRFKDVLYFVTRLSTFHQACYS